MRFDAQYVAQGAAKLMEAKFGGLKRKMKNMPVQLHKHSKM